MNCLYQKKNFLLKQKTLRNNTLHFVSLKQMWFWQWFPLKTDFRRDCSPEGSVCLGCQQRGGGWLELLRAHAHGLLHLGGGGRDEVLVNVAAQALLPQHPAHQLQGGAEGLLASGYLGPETVRTKNLVINEYFYENESVRGLCDEYYPIFFHLFHIKRGCWVSKIADCTDLN